MIEQKLNKLTDPRPGGWNRLAIKLKQKEKEQDLEMLTLKKLASGMAFLLVLTSISMFQLINPNPNLSDQLIKEDVWVSNGEATPVETNSKEVRFYWVFK